MPYLENELWQPLKDSGLTVLIVGREHSLEEVSEYTSKLNLTMPAIADADRSIYSKYAKRSIPRTFVIDKGGNVVFAELGFSPDKFEKIKTAVSQLLGAENLAPTRAPAADKPSAIPSFGKPQQSPTSLTKTTQSDRQLFAGQLVNSDVSAKKTEGEREKSGAVGNLESVRSSSPSDKGTIVIQAAMGCISGGNYDKAISDLQSFLSQWPKHAQAHYLLAVCFSQKRNFDSAAEEYNAAIKHTSDPKLRALAEMGLKRIHR